jgi:hypothetical protein
MIDSEIKESPKVLREEIVPNAIPKIEEVTPKDLLRLGRHVLLSVLLIFVFSAVLAIFYPVNGMPIFESCKIILPPFATLVIGYYFGKT